MYINFYTIFSSTLKIALSAFISNQFCFEFIKNLFQVYCFILLSCLFYIYFNLLSCLKASLSLAQLKRLLL